MRLRMVSWEFSMTGRRGASLPAIFPSRMSRRPFTLIAIARGLDAGGALRDRLSLVVEVSLSAPARSIVRFMFPN